MGSRRAARRGGTRTAAAACRITASPSTPASAGASAATSSEGALQSRPGRRSPPRGPSEVAPVDPQIAKVVRSLPAHGVLVARVEKESPAATAGLKAGTKQITVDGESALVGGDVIVSADGKDIRSPAQLSDAVSARMPGDVITLDVSRNGHERTVGVKLGKAP